MKRKILLKPFFVLTALLLSLHLSVFGANQKKVQSNTEKKTIIKTKLSNPSQNRVSASSPQQSKATTVTQNTSSKESKNPPLQKNDEDDFPVTVENSNEFIIHPFDFQIGMQFFSGVILPAIENPGDPRPSIFHPTRMASGVSFSLEMFFIKFLSFRLETMILPFSVYKHFTYAIGGSGRVYLWNFFAGAGIFYNLAKINNIEEEGQSIPNNYLTLSIDAGFFIPISSNASLEFMARYLKNIGGTFLIYVDGLTTYRYPLNIILFSLGVNYKF
jgi:hypothetical protein